MRTVLFAVMIALLVPATVRAETVNVKATGSGKVVGEVVPVFDGRVDIVAIGTKKSSKTWAMGVFDSAGDFICFSITGSERTATCGFAGAAFEVYTVIVLSASGSLPIVVNVDGPSAEPWLRFKQPSGSIDMTPSIERMRARLRAAKD